MHLMMTQVEMTRDLVIYLLKQGPYSGQGDIAVLCAYLGQLQKVRAALRDVKLTISVDERDEDQLRRQGDGEEAERQSENVSVAKHVGISDNAASWSLDQGIDPTRYSGHISRRRGENRHRFPGKKFGIFRGRFIFYRVSEGMP